MQTENKLSLGKKKDKKTHGESKNKQNKTENNDNKKLHFLVKLET